MGKVKAKEEIKTVEQSTNLPTSVPGKSWDPADTSINNNSDVPAYVSPISVQRAYNPMMTQIIIEGGGESRPMFSSSLKE
jgi:hypothetical protein